MAASLTADRSLPRPARALPRVWVPGVDTPKRLRMLEPLQERLRAEQRLQGERSASRIQMRPTWWQRLGDWLVSAGEDAMQRDARSWTLPR